MTLSTLFQSIRRHLKTKPRRSRRNEGYPGSQILESRILPATLVNPTTLTYRDFDGDDVTVSFLDPILNAGNVNSVFTFNSWNVSGNNQLPQQLRNINLSGIPAAAGTTITTVATRHPAAGGDGFAAVGQIDATGLDLEAVTIDGDLGRILAGNSQDPAPGVTDLSVYSMGRYGTRTGAVNLTSTIQGPMSSLAVKADIKGAFVQVVGGEAGTLDIVTVGGSIMGNGDANSGRVHSTGNMGKVTVTGDLIGGGGTHSGAITTFQNITSVSIGGSIIGGSGTYAGTILSDYLGGGPKKDEFGGHIGPVSVGRDVQGGSNTAAGTIVSESGRLGNVTIGGSLLAGSANRSAHVYSGMEMGNVVIAGSVVGGVGLQSAQVQSLMTMGNVTVGGSLIGGAGDRSGQFSSKLDMGNISFSRNIIGGDGLSSGRVYSGEDVGTVKILGSVRGGSSERSGEIYALRTMGNVTVAGDVVGGAGKASGRVDADSIASVTVSGSVTGGVGASSGVIQGRSGAVPTLRVTGNVVGGSGVSSGAIGANQLGTVTIGGSLIGGSSSNTGQVFSTVSITSLTIGGNIRGGSATGTKELVGSGTVRCTSGSIAAMTVKGSLIAGTDATTGQFADNGAIHAGTSIGTLEIRGNVLGNSTTAAFISAYGQKSPPMNSDIAIGTLRVLGGMEYGFIYAGLGIGGQKNADAQIGTVYVAGDWLASSVVAGAATGADGKFGTMDDEKLSGPQTKDLPNVKSMINHFTVAGQLISTEFTSDTYGVVAEAVNNLSIGGEIIPLLPGPHNDISVLLIMNLDLTLGDFWLRELQPNLT